MELIKLMSNRNIAKVTTLIFVIIAHFLVAAKTIPFSLLMVTILLAMAVRVYCLVQKQKPHISYVVFVN